MATAHARRLRAALALVGAWGLLTLAGCGGLRLVPVSGKVLLNGKPLTVGRVCFNPDPSRGNKARVVCVGRLNAQGEYTLTTAGVTRSEGGKGAPPGWYKVTLLNPTGSNELDDKVKGVYFDEDKTPLAVEVVDSPPPAHYDFTVSR